MTRTTLLAACALLSIALPARAQEAAPHGHDHGGQIGTVNFPISCNAEAQRHFTRGVAWLHSFEYEDAERAFLESAAADPACGMSHWGLAMSQYHPLWTAPTPAELEKGTRAIERAASQSAATPRERDYIAALGTFYAGADRIGHRERVFAYEAAMERLHRQHLSDREAAVFHALSMIAAGMIDDDPGFARERRAAAILDAVLGPEPNHPGVTHYLIHSYDYPQLAHLAVAAARRYAGIAPASAHAQHMPSHIFTRLGLWEDMIRSNVAAEAAARAYAEREGLPGAWDQGLHAMDYMAYGYLQVAQDADARRVLDTQNRIERVDPAGFSAAHSFAAIPARFALERRQWREAAALALAPGPLAAIPWQQYRWAEAHIHFARAVGAARSGDPAAARQEIAILESIRQAAASASGNYDWATQVEIERRIAAAWADAAEGRHAEALVLMRSAADLDDATEKHPVTPGAILPAREQLGDMLFERGRHAEALAAYEASLLRAPRRFNALYGAAAASRAAGDSERARHYYGAVLEVAGASTGSGRADETARPELAEARAYLAAHPR